MSFIGIGLLWAGPIPSPSPSIPTGTPSPLPSLVPTPSVLDSPPPCTVCATISWAPHEEDGSEIDYIVYVRPDGGPYEEPSITRDTSLTLCGLEPNARYYYQVDVRLTTGEASHVTETSFDTDPCF